MARFIPKPTIIKAAGNMPKEIAEYVGNVNTDSSDISIAKMTSPEGWVEPGQTPGFTEYTIVLKGLLRAECHDRAYDIRAGEAIRIGPDEWVRYSSPHPGGAEYIAVCLPAFSPDTVRRDE
ncbi:MAG: cupin [Spirochaetes bacterium GWF1_51_8]|nr:MAG: cupin [Spirochaetes bacterium GWF1_51_8]